MGGMAARGWAATAAARFCRALPCAGRGGEGGKWGVIVIVVVAAAATVAAVFKFHIFILLQFLIFNYKVILKITPILRRNTKNYASTSTNPVV